MRLQPYNKINELHARSRWYGGIHLGWCIEEISTGRFWKRRCLKMLRHNTSFLTIMAGSFLMYVTIGTISMRKARSNLNSSRRWTARSQGKARDVQKVLSSGPPTPLRYIKDKYLVRRKLQKTSENICVKMSFFPSLQVLTLALLVAAVSTRSISESIEAEVDDAYPETSSSEDRSKRQMWFEMQPVYYPQSFGPAPQMNYRAPNIYGWVFSRISVLISWQIIEWVPFGGRFNEPIAAQPVRALFPDYAYQYPGQEYYRVAQPIYFQQLNSLIQQLIASLTSIVRPATTTPAPLAPTTEETAPTTF